METKRTPLTDWHKAAGAKLVPFAGWVMPLSYTSQVAEHVRTRTSASLFDVSHMGQICIQGPQADVFCDWLLPNTVSGLEIGSQASYHPLCREDGTIVDDLLIYPISTDHYLLCVNAVNVDKDMQHILDQAKIFRFEGSIENKSDQFAQIALQGPKSQAILAQAYPEWAELRRFRFSCADSGWLVSRTGYTGEDGYEFYIPNQDAVSVWETLLETAESLGVECAPAGLGARDTLRLEAGYPLYGHELDDEHTAIQSGLGLFCKTEHKTFLGSDVLAAQKQTSPQTRLVAFKSESKRAPRQGQMLTDEHGHEVGQVVSGAFGPTVGVGIGTGFLSIQREQVWAVSPQGRLSLTVCELPFYTAFKRKKKE